MRSDDSETDQRENLLLQTLTSLQRLASAPPKNPTSPPVTANAAPDVPPPPRLPIQNTRLREDIRARVEAFKARQQAMQADREAYYERTFRRVRAVTDRWD